MDLNPYAPTTTTPTQSDVADLSDLESIRRKYLSHEASLKSVGLLYLLGAIPSFLMGGMWLFSVISASLNFVSANAPTETPSELIGVILFIGLATLVFGLLQGYAGWNLRTLNPSGKIPAIIVAAFGLLGIPIGTLISIYILYLLLGAKGEYVMSPEYKAIMQATPHIRYKTSIVVWILLFLLLFVFLFALVGIIVSGTRKF